VTGFCRSLTSFTNDRENWVLEGGIGVARDHDHAVALLDRAHGRTFATDQYYYARNLAQGKGCRQQKAESLKYLKISAGYDCIRALYTVG
jgi:TPR repeat protein